MATSSFKASLPSLPNKPSLLLAYKNILEYLLLRYNKL